MALAAATVIDALAARLTGLPLAGTRVYTARPWPLAEGELPAWLVVADGETVSLAQIDDSTNEHALAAIAVGKVRAVSNVDDAMHALAAEGIAALFAPPVPYGLQLDAIERQVTADGEAAIGEIALRLTARYWVNPATPESIYS